MRDISTQLMHEGEFEPRIEGALVTPIFQSSTFLSENWDSARYIRFANTPGHQSLHKKFAAIENAEASVSTSSGMAAIATALMTAFSPGDHIIAQNALYGGTLKLFNSLLVRYGLEFDFVDLTKPGQLEKKLKATTKGVYFEALSNPTLEVPDFASLVEFCGRHDLLSIVDSTFATPVNFRPLDAGIDVAIHSATKYLNGHSDIVAGLIAGRADFVEKCRQTILELGGALDPHAVFLLQRGLKTLSLRVRAQNVSALELATWLTGSSVVELVRYPFLRTDPSYANARRYLEGGGGVLSFDVGSLDRATSVTRRLKIARVAPSLGGCETLVMIPAILSHASMSPVDRKDIGVTDGLIRVAVGLEDVRDLIADFEQALGSA